MTNIVLHRNRKLIVGAVFGGKGSIARSFRHKIAKVAAQRGVTIESLLAFVSDLVLLPSRPIGSVGYRAYHAPTAATRPIPAVVVGTNLVVELPTPGVTTPIVIAEYPPRHPLSPRQSALLRTWTAYPGGPPPSSTGLVIELWPPFPAGGIPPYVPPNPTGGFTFYPPFPTGNFPPQPIGGGFTIYPPDPTGGFTSAEPGTEGLRPLQKSKPLPSW